MKAKDVMTPNPTTRRPEDDLRNVLEVMRKEDVGIVPITEGNGDQKIAGVVTDRDIALYLGERDRKPSDVRVSDVMTKDVISVSPDADIQEVSRKMQDAQVRRVCVTEGKRLTGVIATADLARASAQSSRDKVGEEVEKVMEKVSADTSHRARP